MILTIEDFKKRIELSLCQHYASDEDVRDFCKRAVEAGVGVVCVNPVNIPLVAEIMSGVSIEISANIGFPFGSHYGEVKVLETERAVREGATQIDMVINVGALKSGRDKAVFQEIRGVVDAAGGRIVKVIIETWVLNNEEKKRASMLAEDADADLVKTSTGVKTQYLSTFGSNPVGAVIEDIRLLRKILSPRMRIKASGGIHTVDDAVAFIEAGADQLGVSRGRELVKEFETRYGNHIRIKRADVL